MPSRAPLREKASPAPIRNPVRNYDRRLSEILRCATEVFSGEEGTVPEALAARLRAAGMYDELARSRGTYIQHYPFVFRRLLPEETLISMGSDMPEACYSISIFTYHGPRRRLAYYGFCSFLARCMTRLLDARLHWGKHFPLEADEIARSYPRLEVFKQLSRRTDPGGVFRNAFTKRVLGL